MSDLRDVIIYFISWKIVSLKLNLVSFVLGPVIWCFIILLVLAMMVLNVKCLNCPVILMKCVSTTGTCATLYVLLSAATCPTPQLSAVRARARAHVSELVDKCLFSCEAAASQSTRKHLVRWRQVVSQMQVLAF